jgi:hypothetical protein
LSPACPLLVPCLSEAQSALASSVRGVIIGAARLPRDILDRFGRWGFLVRVDPETADDMRG